MPALLPLHTQLSPPTSFSSLLLLRHSQFPRPSVPIKASLRQSSPSPPASAPSTFHPPHHPLDSSLHHETTEAPPQQQPLTVIIAGGGIGGLVLALALKNKGIRVNVLERDLSAIRGEGQYRGPIQVQSNALAALEMVDMDVAEQVMAHGCITGDRINGLVDGITGSWYIKFDTFTPAAERGLPVTRVISRMTLQEILAHAVGPEIIKNGSNVIDFQDDGSKVTVMLDDGRKCEGDLLVGADGIRSKVRTKLLGPCDATYSSYTCYTGIADFVPPDIEVVGYRVFLGHKQYFVSSDVGHGKMQWYAFNNEPAGGTDFAGGRKKRLLELFGGWCDEVVDLLLATPEEMILRRDIYDRTPISNWSTGRVTLLGDSAHAMQPNMGQGGCMAIEDAHQLALELEKALKKSSDEGKSVDIPAALKSYERSRIIRVGAIHGMARMAAIMASTYKPYLGVGLGPLEFLSKLRIPHPGRVGGRIFISIAMPLMLNWVLGGNSSKLEGRIPKCRLTDRASSQLGRWFVDDDALQKAVKAEWYLLPVGIQVAKPDLETYVPRAFHLSKDEGRPTIIGRVACQESEGIPAVIASQQVSETHAKITFKDGAFYITALQSATWVTDIEGRSYRIPSSLPVRIHPGDIINFGENKQAAFKVKLSKATAQKSFSAEENTELELANTLFAT